MKEFGKKVIAFNGSFRKEGPAQERARGRGLQRGKSIMQLDTQDSEIMGSFLGR